MIQPPSLRQSRRNFLSYSAVIFGAPRITLGQSGGSIAETNHGRVKGLTADGITTFLGIPYGADTAGRNRFMPPQPPANWSGVRDCTDWGHLAPQRVAPNPSEYTQYVRWNNYRGGMSEDCLRVNVWTPGLRGKRAVMFIIHGGGYTSGSGNLEALEG
jgi:para-nitrobenzyl esterase